MSKTTTLTIRIEVPGNAASFGTQSTVFRRNGQMVRGTKKTDSASDWESAVRLAAATAYDGPLLEGPVEVCWTAVFSLPKGRWRKRDPRPREFKTTKPDSDKIERLILDGLAGVVYGHDAQVARTIGTKLNGAQGEQARTTITVLQLTDFEER